MEMPVYAAEEDGQNIESSYAEEEIESQEASDTEDETALPQDEGHEAATEDNTNNDSVTGEEVQTDGNSEDILDQISDETEKSDPEDMNSDAETGSTTDDNKVEENGTIGNTDAAAEEVEESAEINEAKNASDEGFSLVMSEEAISLKRSETFQLTAELKANQSEETSGDTEGDSEDKTSEIPESYSVEWKSDKDRIVSVNSNGLVTAVRAGSAVITATVEGYDADDYYFELSAQCTVTVTADPEGVCGDNLTWNIDDAGNLVVNGSGEMYDYDSVWDDDIEKYVSTSPFSDFIVRTVVFEEGVTSVGSNAFCGQDQLTGITFYPQMECISDSSFNRCSNLSEVDFQGKITEWKDDYTIYYGSYYDEEAPDIIYKVFDTDGITRLNLIDIGSCDTNLIWAVDQDKTLYVCGEGQIDSGYWSPWRNYDIEKVVIKEGVTGIGDYAFYDCKNLTSIEIPASVTSIGESVTYGWNNVGITDVYYAGKITQWFDKKEVAWAWGESKPLIHCLSADGSNSITIYEKGKINKNLSWVLDGQHVLTITGKGAMGEYVYDEWWSDDLVKKVVIGSGVTAIGDSAFAGCTNMTSVTIPGTVRKIGNYAFSNSGIISIILPESVREVGYSAFSHCEKLKTVKLSTGMASTPDFEGCSSLTTITIPKGTKSIGSFEGCKSLQKIVVPAGVEYVGGFKDCTSLTSLSFPDSVYSIGRCSGCSKLVSVKLSRRLNYLWSEAFKDCTKLTTITNLDRVSEIGKDAFSGCKALKTINLRYITNIEDSAFENCSALTTVTLPISLNEVGYYAFNGCIKLTTVNYEGTSALWKKIKIGKYNTPLTKAKRNYSGFTKESPKIYETKVKTGYDYDHRNKDGTVPKKRGIYLYWEWIGGGRVYDNSPAVVFRVLRKGPGDKSWVKVADVQNEGCYFDTNIKWGTYKYTVRCMNSSKTKYISDYDKTGVTVKNWLATPTLSTVANSASGVQLKWKKSSSAKKYRVFRRIGTGKWAKLIDTTAVSFVDKKVSSGKKYSYKVRCITSDGKTYTSLEAAAKTITYIKMPKVTKLQNVTGGVKVNWSKSAGAAKYRVLRKTSGKSWAKLVDTTSLNYVDKTAQKGVTYYYTVRCISADGKTYTSAYDSKGMSIVKK